MIHFLKKGEWNRRFDSGPRLHSLKYWHSVGPMAIFSLKWQQKWQQVWLYLSMFWVVYFYTKQGAGGLVFQDRYRLDRLTHMKNFSQCRKWGFFQKTIRLSPTLTAGLRSWNWMLVTRTRPTTVSVPHKKVLNIFFNGFFKLLSSRLQYGRVEFDWFVLSFFPPNNRKVNHYQKKDYKNPTHFK